MALVFDRLALFFPFLPSFCVKEMDVTAVPTMLFGHPLIQKYFLPIMLVPYLPDNFGLGPLKVVVSAFVMGYRIRMLSSFLCSRVTFVPDVLGVCQETGEDGHVYDILSFIVMLLVFISKLPALAKSLKTYPHVRFNRTKWEEEVKKAPEEECKMTEVVIVGAGIAGASLGLFAFFYFFPLLFSSSFPF